MKLRNITSIFVMAAIAGAAYAIPDSSLIYMMGSGKGGGGSLNPSATNTVLEAAYHYTDTATTNTLALAYANTASATNAVVESFIASDPNLWANNSRLVVDGNNVAAGNTDVVVMNNNIVSFEMTDEGDYDIMAEYYTEDSNHLILGVAEETPGTKWYVLFTTATLNVPVDFNLVITVKPKTGIASRDSKVLVYKLRRTF